MISCSKNGLTQQYSNMFGVNTTLFVNLGSQVHKITLEDGKIHCVEENALATDQEEADTKVFLCVKQAKPCGYDKICVSAVDTDIVIYAIYFSTIVAHHYSLRSEFVIRRRILGISNIIQELGEDISSALLALHAFTGNDYTSAFHGIGKKKAFTITRKSQEYVRAFKEIV